ncbi:Fic family protein [Arcicella sp. DC2W]|uniref:protein adenylyltransferase n=1 Tax=Arcicella gelida TaxID=2984195 RepID=A0ABU5S3R5_9BACT|nr:Fic family protein [Arcicella sp. DC2W]MEA5403096.1 Fic family protein [Arcicella sp. DC2W]
MKYQIQYDQNEHLPNLLGLKTNEEVALAEFEGFLKAEILLTESLKNNTKLNVKYIFRIHQLALGQLYEFAGKYRTVNLSKGGFVFASAQFLHQSMLSFEETFLKEIPNSTNIITQVAKTHAELLFIHPFREGNGRTSRIFTNLYCRKYGYQAPKWELINEQNLMESYIRSVQQAGLQNYKPMEKLIEQIWGGSLQP